PWMGPVLFLAAALRATCPPVVDAINQQLPVLGLHSEHQLPHDLPVEFGEIIGPTTADGGGSRFWLSGLAGRLGLLRYPDRPSALAVWTADLGPCRPRFHSCTVRPA